MKLKNGSFLVAQGDPFVKDITDFSNCIFNCQPPPSSHNKLQHKPLYEINCLKQYTKLL